MPRKSKNAVLKTNAKKDPFDDLPDEFKDAVAAMNRTAIRERIAQVALDQQSLLEAKEKDTDFLKAREQAKEAGAVYREGTKMNKLKIAFAKRCLDDKGG